MKTCRETQQVAFDVLNLCLPFNFRERVSSLMVYRELVANVIHHIILTNI